MKSYNDFTKDLADQLDEETTQPTGEQIVEETVIIGSELTEARRMRRRSRKHMKAAWMAKYDDELKNRTDYKPGKTDWDAALFLWGSGKDPVLAAQDAVAPFLEDVIEDDEIELTTEQQLLEKTSKYKIYHNMMASAFDEARSYLDKNGYEFDEDDYFNKVAVGPKKPSSGKTNSYSIEVVDKKSKKKKMFQVQIHGMPKGSYELNMYGLSGATLKD